MRVGGGHPGGKKENVKMAVIFQGKLRVFLLWKKRERPCSGMF